MRKVVAEKIADEVAEWGHRGLVSPEQQAVLAERYSIDITMGRLLLRWLGFIALVLLAMSVLGFIGMMIGEAAIYLAPPLLGAVAAALWMKGTEMAVDPAQHYATSGAVLVTFSLLVGFAAMATLYEAFGGGSYRIAAPLMMSIAGAAGLFTAYRYGLRWPLLLGVLMTFHALGHMHSYGGSGSYFMAIEDERVMLVVASVAVLVGMWHERSLEREQTRWTGFGHVYLVFGLLYANLSFWFLSLPRGHLTAVLLFTAAGIAQIVAGGRFHDGRFVGFGIVFLSINLYTRMFEGFWDELSKGTFFLLAGGAALAVGIVFESRARRLRPRVTE